MHCFCFGVLMYMGCVCVCVCIYVCVCVCVYIEMGSDKEQREPHDIRVYAVTYSCLNKETALWQRFTHSHGVSSPFHLQGS